MKTLIPLAMKKLRELKLLLHSFRECLPIIAISLIILAYRQGFDFQMLHNLHKIADIIYKTFGPVFAFIQFVSYELDMEAAMTMEDSGALDLHSMEINVNDETAKLMNYKALYDVYEIKQREACLVMIVGEDLGQRFPLQGNAITIGRSPACEISLQDAALSRRHCRIVPSNEGAVLVDLESTNRTYLNDEEVVVRPLNDGDCIKIGSTQFKYLYGDRSEQVYFEEIYRLMTRDALTGAMNKRVFDKELDRFFSLFLRHGNRMSLIMMDIDHFKKFNDKHGHLAGDKVLADLGEIIREEKRNEDIFCRFGGEEFVLLLPETGISGAVQIAERLRQRLSEHTFEFDDKKLDVTLSFGVAELTEGIRDKDQLVKQADNRLYMAKRQGRNQVVPNLDD